MPYVMLRQLSFQGEKDQPGIDLVTGEEVPAEWRGRSITLDGRDVTDQINSGQLQAGTPNNGGAGSGQYLPGGWTNLQNNYKGLIDPRGNLVSIMRGPSPDSMSDLRGLLQTAGDTSAIWGSALGANAALGAMTNFAAAPSWGGVLPAISGASAAFGPATGGALSLPADVRQLMALYGIGDRFVNPPNPVMTSNGVTYSVSGGNEPSGFSTEVTGMEDGFDTNWFDFPDPSLGDVPSWMSSTQGDPRFGGIGGGVNDSGGGWGGGEMYQPWMSETQGDPRFGGMGGGVNDAGGGWGGGADPSTGMLPYGMVNWGGFQPGISSGWGTSAGASSVLGRILSGQKLNLEDILRAGGALGSAALGAYGANQMADAYRSVGDAQRQAEMERFNTLVGLDRERYQTAMQREDAAIAKRDAMIAEAKAIGAPSRDRYEASYAPGFTMQNDPGYMDALNQTGNATMRAMSVGGNPSDSPNAWSKTLEDLFTKTAYPALQQYRSNNAATGGYSSFAGAGATIPGIGSNVPTGSTAGSGVGTQAGSQANLASIQSGSGVYNAIGGALADLTTPTRSIEDILKAMGGGNNVFAYGR